MKSKNLTHLMTHPLILMWFMVLGGLAMFLLGRQAHSWYLQISSQAITPQMTQYSIGDYIQTKGTIRGQYGFGLLQFTSDKGEQRILKSTVTNITHLTGDVTIQGTLSEYNGAVPVLNVSQYDAQGTSNTVQYRYDSLNKIAFRPGYDVAIVASGDLITITDPVVNKEVVRIRSFSCSGTGAYDECSIEGSDQYPYFVSSYRHKFFQGDNVWYVFGDGIGYRIWASDEYYVNMMSQYFDLMNTRLMADIVRGQLKTKCVGPQTNVVEYVSHTMREQNGNTFVIVRGLNSDKKLAVCQLNLITTDNTISFEGITTIPVEG